MINDKFSVLIHYLRTEERLKANQILQQNGEFNNVRQVQEDFDKIKAELEEQDPLKEIEMLAGYVNRYGIPINEFAKLYGYFGNAHEEIVFDVLKNPNEQTISNLIAYAEAHDRRYIERHGSLRELNEKRLATCGHVVLFILKCILSVVLVPGALLASLATFSFDPMHTYGEFMRQSLVSISRNNMEAKAASDNLNYNRARKSTQACTSKITEFFATGGSVDTLEENNSSEHGGNQNLLGFN